MSFLDPITASGPATALQTNTSTPVNVDAANAPTAGQVLTATDAAHATWQDPTGGGGGGGDGGNAGGLETTGAPVDVSAAAPPYAGQVLTATSPTTSVWRVPGLRYDAGVRFWLGSVGTASIEPGTWGLANELPVGATEGTITIVSSLEAPPVDSRFAVYVARAVTATIHVNIIGAASIQALDATLHTSIVVPSGAFLEWVLYHDPDLGAVWGLVSDTAGLSKRFAAPWVGEAETFPIVQATEPALGSALTYSQDVDENTIAEWKLPAASLAFAMNNALTVDVVRTADGELYGNSVPIDGVSPSAVNKIVLAVGQADPTENGFWETFDGPWTVPDGYPAPAAIPIGASALVRDGDTYTESLWVHFGGGEWGQVTPGSGIVAGSGLTRVGNALAFAGDLSLQPTAGQKSALAGTSGTPGAGNAYVTDADARNSNARTPTAHASSHLTGGSDPIDVTTLMSAWSVWKLPCKLAGTASLPLSGLAAIDSTAVNAGDRILAPFQTTATQCGIYIAAAGAWSRAPDCDTSAKIYSGMQVAVTSGTLYIDSVWTLTSPEGQPTLGTSNLVFTRTDTRGYSPSLTPSAITPVVSGSPGASGRWADQSHIHSFPSPNPSHSGYRISTASGSPVPGDGTFSTIWATPYRGSKLSLYSGTAWFLCEFGSGGGNVSLAVSGMTAGIPADVFAAFGVLTSWTLELTPWASATARSTALALQDGVAVKSGAPTRRYLGTILPDSATTFTHTANPAAGAKAVCGIWNQDNRIQSTFQWLAPSGTPSPSTANVWAALPGQTTPHVELMLGQSIDAYSARAVSTVTGASAAVMSAIGIGVDSTSAVQGTRNMASGVASTAFSQLVAHRTIKPSTPGVKNVNMLAQVSATGPTFYGQQDLAQSGLTVDFWH